MFRTLRWCVLIFIAAIEAKVPRIFKKDKKLYCVMCNSIIHTISERMEHFVGRPPLKQGFRLSDEGKKIYKEIPYTQSEGVLLEVLEDLLPESYSGYTTKNDKKVKPRHRLMVGNSFAGGLSTKGESMSMSGDAGELLKKMGDRFIMDYNDKLFELLKEEGHHSVNFVKFCKNQITKKCGSNKGMDADAIYAARGKTVWRPKNEL